GRLGRSDTAGGPGAGRVVGGGRLRHGGRGQPGGAVMAPLAWRRRSVGTPDGASQDARAGSYVDGRVCKEQPMRHIGLRVSGCPDPLRWITRYTRIRKAHGGPARDLRPRAPLRLAPPPSCDARPGSTAPRSAVLRGTPAVTVPHGVLPG